MINRPPQEDIDSALQIERGVTDDLQALYLKCLHDLPMSKRTTNQELHDGCVLTHHVYQKCS